MTRILSCLTAALLASAVSAQCFEPNFGVLIPRGTNAAGVGDDVIFDVQSMGITFPMGGLAASYDSVHVQSNGVCFLTNALAVSGATTTGYSSSVATMTTNLLGTATQPPRIAAYWRDLNILAANNAGVYINNTIAGKCVITWDNCVHFGQTSPVFTLQAQLFDTGVVDIFYNGSVQNTAVSPMCGVSQGAAVADPGAIDLSAGSVGVSTSLIAYEVFATASTFDLQTTSVSFAPNALGGYDVISSSCVPATHTAYGAGCYNYVEANQAVYQNFLDGAAAGTALNGTSFTLTPTVDGYTMSNGGGTYVVPSATATTLALGDDASVPYTPSTPFPHVAGPVTDIEIHSNSFVSMGPGNSNSAYGSVPLLLNSPVASFRMNMDLNPAIGGAVKVEEVGTVLYVTWEDVPRFGFPGAPERMQMQLDLNSGVVTYVFDLLTIGTAVGDTVVGYAPGPSGDPGAIDLATQLPVTTSPDVVLNAMSLSASPTPVSTTVSGTTVVYTTDNIPEAGPATGLYVSVTILSLGQDPIGMDLAAIGAPGCSSFLSSNDVFLPVMFGGPSDTTSFDIPAGVPSGVQLFAQSAALVIPSSLPGGFNAGGVLTSNGVASLISGF